jgi:undecaprenyl-diphosphatase
LAGIFYLSSRGRAFELAFLILFTMAIADVTLLFLKTVYFRPRPYIVLPGVNLPFGPAGGSSFPSGHTARASAVMMLIFFKKGRNYTPLLVIATGVAFSRVLLGVHFPLDLVGGAFLGLFIGTLSVRFGERLARFVVSILPDRLKPLAK